MGPPGPPGETPEPVSTTLTRDTNGNVATATAEGQATWTFSRDANGRVTGLTNGVKAVVVNRDGSGAVAGTSVTDV